MTRLIAEALAEIERGRTEIVPREELARKLERFEATGRALRVKLGIDPSAPHLTLGNAVPLRKMRQFQDLGHTGVLVVGDFTRRIGDPSGRSATRPMITAEEIERNMATYEEQAFKILDPKRTEVRYNSEWLGRLTFADVIELASKYTVARMLERDDFAKRFAEERPITVLEFLYPLAQAYDSVAIEADVELGGEDQRFNLLAGREIQREYGQDPQVAVLVPILVGTDGVQKMSKSFNNYIAVQEEPKEMFGKLMSIPDGATGPYFDALTHVPDEQRESSPRDRKRQLAREVVKEFHSAEAADAAQVEFDRVFVQHERPSDVPRVSIDRALLKEGGTIWVVDLLEASGLVTSRAEAKRLIAQGGVKIGGERVAREDLDVPFAPPLLIQVGKRAFAEAL
jgi:tyrosyl-tRNA synthetase